MIYLPRLKCHASFWDHVLEVLLLRYSVWETKHAVNKEIAGGAKLGKYVAAGGSKKRGGGAKEL